MHAVEHRKQTLLSYNPERTIENERLERYWAGVLDESSNTPLAIFRNTVDSPFPSIKVERLTYSGFDGTPIHGWFLTPQAVEADKQIPCIVTFPGYTDDKGLPERYAVWLLLGYAVLAIDARGQSGETGHSTAQEAGSAKGWVSQGIADIERSYYKMLSVDAIRAVDAAAAQQEVDASRIAVVGSSQGGGMALIAAALNPKVAAVVADIPNLCHMDFGVMNSTSSLTEIATYLKRYPEQLEDVLDTLAHFDILNLAHRITAPVLMSVGWKDTVCMPETVYAVYNRILSNKMMNDYPFSGHEVSEYQKRVAIEFLQEQFGNKLI